MEEEREQAGSQRRSEIGPMTLIKAFSGGDNVVIINRWRRRAKIPIHVHVSICTYVYVYIYDFDSLDRVFPFQK